MTLIAMTINQKIPLLISDLLWSAEGIVTVARLPALSYEYERYLPKDEIDKPAKLGQKMYIVADHVCLLFSGENREIIPFILLFKDTFKHPDELSFDRIRQFLEAYNLEKHFPGSGFMLIYIDSKHKPRGFKFYVPEQVHKVEVDSFVIEPSFWNVLNEDTFGKTMALGTGVKGFLKIVKEEVKVTNHVKPDPFMAAIQRNACLLARLLTLERTSLHTIADLWGGGFEMAYFNGERFEKVDRIAYVISHSRFDDTGDIGEPIPMLTMYYKYLNDILYITAIEVFEFAITDDSTHTIFTAPFGKFRTTIFEVEGLDIEDVNQIPMPISFSFSTDRVAMGYSLELPDAAPFNPAFFNMGTAVTVSFEQGKSFEIRLYRPFGQEIRDMAKRAFPRLIKK